MTLNLEMDMLYILFLEKETFKMKKLLIIAMATMTLFLTGCAKGKDVTALDINSLDASNPDNFMECLADIIQNRDGERLYNFFSEDTKQYDANLAIETQEFVDSFEGDIVSYDLSGSETSEKTQPDEDDKYSQMIRASYNVTTTENKYHISFYYTNETPQKNYLGLQTLGVQQLEDYENDHCICSDIHGCYVVTPDNHEELLERKDYDLEHADW